MGRRFSSASVVISTLYDVLVVVVSSAAAAWWVEERDERVDRRGSSVAMGTTTSVVSLRDPFLRRPLASATIGRDSAAAADDDDDDDEDDDALTSTSVDSDHPISIHRSKEKRKQLS